MTGPECGPAPVVATLRKAGDLDAALDRIEAIATAPATKTASPSAAAASATGPEAGTPARSRSRGCRKDRTPRPRQKASLLDLGADLELWRDANGDGFVSYDNAEGVREHAPIASRNFRDQLALRFLGRTGEVPSATALDDVIRIFSARALTAPRCAPILRVGEGLGGAIVIDRCTPDGSYINVTGRGFELLSDGVPKFIRKRGMTPIVLPEPGSSISLLRPFINTSNDGFILIVGWLVQALRAVGPFPILVLSGEQGTGKSTVSMLLRRLADPSSVPIAAPPKDLRDLVVGATNARVLAFDNLSRIDAELSDGLCRMATGGGARTRALHTNTDEIFFEGSRPQILNGIGALSERADLADRILVVNLHAIADDARRCESDFWRSFDAVEPAILGALCSAVACGLRNFESTRLDRMPRLADFARWVTACEPGLGDDWITNSFMTAYMANRADARESAFESDAVAGAIEKFVRTDRPEGWCGTATELLDALNVRASDELKRRRDWPYSTQGLGNRLDRAAPLLRARGFTIERRHSGVRTITIILKEGVHV